MLLVGVRAIPYFAMRDRVDGEEALRCPGYLDKSCSLPVYGEGWGGV